MMVRRFFDARFGCGSMDKNGPNSVVLDVRKIREWTMGVS